MSLHGWGFTITLGLSASLAHNGGNEIHHVEKQERDGHESRLKNTLFHQAILKRLARLKHRQSAFSVS